MTNFHFRVTATSGRARTGVFSTPHGNITTPVFAPVGTQATVKGITPAQLDEMHASLILANTYHLFLRPGHELIAQLGGLHQFMQWQHPILTDSGGFQIYSLAATRQIDDDGATFRSHIDGSTQRLTPESSIEIQEKLGADIIMALDECAPPYDLEYNRLALKRTHAWAERCWEAKTRPDQALFGIVQGGIFPELRCQSAEIIASMDFPGNAIGGLSVGETKQEMHQILELMDEILPDNRPRYLMGVGSPEDIINGIMRGVDIFDCVLPTRLARHKTAMTMRGRINLLNAINSNSPLPIDETCTCYTCKHFSRAYLRHLISAKEILAPVLISIHNLHMLMQLVQQARQAIIQDKFSEFALSFLHQYEASYT